MQEDEMHTNENANVSTGPDGKVNGNAFYIYSVGVNKDGIMPYITS